MRPNEGADDGARCSKAFNEALTVKGDGPVMSDVDHRLQDVVQMLCGLHVVPRGPRTGGCLIPSCARPLQCPCSGLEFRSPPGVAGTVGRAASRLRGAHDRTDPQVRDLTRRGRAALGGDAFDAAYGRGWALGSGRQQLLPDEGGELLL